MEGRCSLVKPLLVRTLPKTLCIGRERRLLLLPRQVDPLRNLLSHKYRFLKGNPQARLSFVRSHSRPDNSHQAAEVPSARVLTKLLPPNAHLYAILLVGIPSRCLSFTACPFVSTLTRTPDLCW